MFAETLARLKQTHPELAAVVVAVEHQRENLSNMVKDWPVPVVVVGNDDKKHAFAASDAALAASGTVALELAEADVPCVIAYRFKPLTAWLAKRLVKLKYVSLVNLVLDRAAVPELLLENCRADNLSREVSRLLDDQSAREAQRVAFREALAKLGKGSHSPGMRAADAVLAMIKKEQTL